MSDGSVGSFEMAIEPRSVDYQPDDHRWRDQVIRLVSELHQQVDVEPHSTPVAGMKGTLDELVVALGSAGVFTATVECLRAWLGRDRSRRIDVRREENGEQRYVTPSGDAIDVDSVREIAKAAAVADVESEITGFIEKFADPMQAFIRDCRARLEALFPWRSNSSTTTTTSS